MFLVNFLASNASKDLVMSMLGKPGYESLSMYLVSRNFVGVVSCAFFGFNFLLVFLERGNLEHSQVVKITIIVWMQIVAVGVGSKIKRPGGFSSVDRTNLGPSVKLPFLCNFFFWGHFP